MDKDKLYIYILNTFYKTEKNIDLQRRLWLTPVNLCEKLYRHTENLKKMTEFRKKSQSSGDDDHRNRDVIFINKLVIDTHKNNYVVIFLIKYSFFPHNYCYWNTCVVRSNRFF
jgi:hypothetical protein